MSKRQPEPPAKDAGEVTRLLESWQQGSPEALEELMPIVYQELRRLAASYLRRERSGHSFQPTDLVNEAMVRFLGAAAIRPKDRHHFFAISARAMRRILVDHSRRRAASKRDRGLIQITLNSVDVASDAWDFEVLALHRALAKLSEIDSAKAELVELRYFGGLTNPEAAEVLGVSTSTVERQWRAARLWLRSAMTE